MTSVLSLLYLDSLLPVVDEQFVVLQVAGGGRVGLLDVPHELPELRPRLPHPPRHVLGHAEAGAPQHARLAQHLLPVLVLLERGCRHHETFCPGFSNAKLTKNWLAA